MAGAIGDPSSSNGRKIGLRRSWKAEGKKARMKIARKMDVLRMFVSKGIGFGCAVVS